MCDAPAMVKAVYGGSFDPFHLGHLSIVERCAELFGVVIVVVAANPAKSNGMFDRRRRADLVRASVRHLPNVTVEEHHGLTAALAGKLGADVLVRSAHKEAGHELAMAATNDVLAGLQTVFVAPDPGLAWISSTIVRRMALDGCPDDVASMVPRPVHAALASSTVH